MAGQTVGGPDPTGMRGAQNVDGGAKKAIDMAKGVTAKVSGWREERRIKKEVKVESRKREAQRRLDEEEEKREQQDAKPQVDEQSVDGGALTDFNKVFLDAIRRGQSRTIQASSADSAIREVICNETFINAIANCAVRTPLEQMDTEYGKEMAGRRAKLAATLRKAKEQKEFMIGDLSTHEVDIIYATMLGTAEEDALRKTPGAADLWRNTAWPPELPRPPEAFFMFLESVAIRERPDDKGKFIGSVLKGLTIRKTFVDTADTTVRSLVDGTMINEYLHTMSAYQIDTAVESFHSTVVNLLRTPTSQKDSVLGMPGLGYDEGYAQELAVAKVWVEQARQTYTQSEASLQTAVQTHANALITVEAAQKEVNKAVAFGKKAEKQGSIRLEGGVIWAKDGPEIKAALENTSAALKQAQGELGKATTWLDAAKAAKAKAEREFKKRVDEVAIFEAKSNPQAFSKELANHFKSLLEENRDSHVKFIEVADKMEARLPNIAITKLLARATDLMDLMVDTKLHFDPDIVAERQLLDNLTDERRAQLVALATKEYPEAATLLMKDIKKMGGAEKDTDTFAYKKVRFDSEMAKLAQEIEDAQIPEDVKVRLRSTQKCMAGLRHTKDSITSQLGAIGKEHAFPLGKAVKHAVRDLEERSYRNLAGITDAEKIIARMVYEARTGELKGLPGNRESKWARFWHSVEFHLFTSESWVSRDYQKPGKLVWLYRKTFSETISDLRPRNWLQRRPGKRPDGTTYKRWQPRIVDGIWGVTWKGYIIGTALAGALITTKPLEHWYSYVNPWNWVGRPATLIAESIHGGPFYLPDSQNHFYYPWSWTMPTESERQIRRVIHDNYDIPERLPSRGAGYYRQSYGVGTHRLPAETTDDGMRARLEWLQSHGDVLRFLQERTTLRMDVHTKILSSDIANPRPETCSNSQTPVPDPCKNLNLGTTELLRDYQPLSINGDYSSTSTNDGWQPGMKVCCTIEVTSRRVPDGLKLNTYTSDAFVDLLMAVERGGGTVNYAYLTNAGNRGRWAQEWYLVTPSEADIISGFKITERDNVRFLTMQGAEASALLLPRCAREPRSPEFLREEQRNAFASAWRAEVVRVLAGMQPAQQPAAPAPAVPGTASAGPAPSAAPTAAPAAATAAPAAATAAITDPLTQDVPANVLEQTFKTVRDQHPDWFMDRTHAYDRAQAAQQVPELNVQTETALDVLVAQSDILDLLKQFGSRTAYSVNSGRSDEFIQVLDQHKRMGGSLEDYNPFRADGPGSRVQWAVQMGYIAPTETFNATGSQAREGADGGTAVPAASAARPAGPAPLPDLTQDAQRFYTNPANDAFTSFFEGVMRGMFTDRGSDGRAFQGVLAARFNGDQARMERAIKGDMFRFLGSASPVDAQARDGITVSGTGSTMTASPRDMAKTRNSLRNHMRQAVMAWGR